MQNKTKYIRQLFGKMPHMPAQICIAILICVLLVTNYISQRHLQQNSINRVQQNLNNNVANINYFLSERENDILDLAASKSVTSFFENKNLGMTMNYGLRSSLNNVTRLFKHRMDFAKLGEKSIYTHICLLDKNGMELAQWPAVKNLKQHPIPVYVKKNNLCQVTSHTDVDAISFLMPVFLNDKLQGYIQTEVSYALLSEQIQSTDSGLLFITDHGRLVFQSQPQIVIQSDALENLQKIGAKGPVELHGENFLTYSETKANKNIFFTIFSSDIPQKKISFYLAEESKSIYNRQALYLVMGILAVISLGGYLTAGSILRGDIKNLVLEASLRESKKREQAVAEKKNELDSIIRNFLDTLIVVDTAMTVTKVNQATCKILGYEEKDLLGKPIHFLFHDPVEDIFNIFGFYNKNRDLIDNVDELRNVELSYRTKDNIQLPMSFNIRLLHDDKGRNVGVIAGAKDISNLKEAIDEVAHQKKYIEKIFDVVPEGLLVLTSEMEIVTCNKAFLKTIQSWCKPFDVTENELTRELLFRLEEALKNFKDCSFTITYKNITAHFNYSVAVMQKFNGIERVVSIRDITEERNDAAASKLLTTVIEQTTESIIITTNDGTIEYVNPATVNVTGYSQEELIGETPALFKSGSDHSETYLQLLETASQGKTWSGRLSTRKKDGTIVTENVNVSPVRDHVGEIVNFVAIKRDVTEIDILQNQLLQAQKLEAIGQLAAGIAHEINTPMQYVQSNVSFLEKAFKDLFVLLASYRHQLNELGSPVVEAARENVGNFNLDFFMEEVPSSIDDTQDGIDRIVKIVSAMKEFSHPGIENKIATDLNNTLESVIVVSSNEWKYVAEMETDFDHSLPMIPCLAGQLYQVVLNLIINSAHAIEETGALVPTRPGKITISTKHDGDWVELRVSDTGSGIPEGVCDRIFDPFFTTKVVGKGSGQGLTIVHDVVVQKHDGTIDFKTAIGQGTTFIIRLPIIAKSKEVTV